MSEKGRNERIVTSEPIDGTAARVMRGGTAWEPSNNLAPTLYHEDTAPPPMGPFTGPRFHDLTGRRFGRFVVVGFDDSERDSKDPARWVCRCVCGRYEMRKSRAVKNAANDGDCCHRCRHLLFLKRRDEAQWTFKSRIASKRETPSE